MAKNLLVFDEQTCQDYASASSREWVEADGSGSYASSSICGTNARWYHGLLVAAVHPPRRALCAAAAASGQNGEGGSGAVLKSSELKLASNSEPIFA
jgi:glycogen debranching enzyme